MTNTIHLQDCIEGMAGYPNKWFDLAVVDPPYGIGISFNSFRQKHHKKNWDNKTPDKSFFAELFRVSKNQIIWGGNYFDLPPTQGFIIWDKKQPENFSSSMCEMAWMSIQSPAKIFRKHVVTAETDKIHPTQKPISLYDWIFKNYATPGMKILDTHVGSMSSVISAIKYGCTIHAYETNADYFAAGKQRVEDYFKQGNLFSDKPEIIFSDSQTESLR